MTKLIFKEKLLSRNTNIPVVDDLGDERYQIEQKTSMGSYRAQIIDNDGKSLVDIERESITKDLKYKISFADGGFASIKKTVGLIKKEIEVKLNNEILTVDGDLGKYNFQVLDQNNEILGSLNLSSKDMSDIYELNVYDSSYEIFLVSLVICVNNMIDLERATNLIIAGSV